MLPAQSCRVPHLLMHTHSRDKVVRGTSTLEYTSQSLQQGQRSWPQLINTEQSKRAILKVCQVKAQCEVDVFH